MSYWRAAGPGGMLAGLLLVGGHFACAATEVETDPPDTTSPTSATVGTGGATVGTGGSGGTGGQGGGRLCEQDCSAVDTPPCFVSVCNDGSHQGTIGSCVIVHDVDGAPCDDEQFCTTQDSCQAGVCTGGPPNDCGMSASTCQEVMCDETAKACTTQAIADGTACTHQDLCLVGTTCLNGVCTGGTANECFFEPVPDDCHVSVCNPLNGMCTPIPGNEGGPCIDTTDLCTVNKTCSVGVCVGGTPKDCSSMTMGCVLGVCDTTTGQCTTQNLMNGDPCDDLVPCTTGETCLNGSCSNGTPITQCTDNDSCCPTSCNATNDTDCAIIDLDIGPYGSTFSSTTATRGYWFQAPVSFTIKELRVPTDVGTDPQNIQVVKFLSGPPPNYSASTTNHVTLALHQNVAGTSYIAVNIPVQAGDYIGILGARGTTTMHNSYGVGFQYNTFILGQPVTLNRLIYQANLFSTPAGALSNEAGGSYTRIEMRYGP